MKFHLQSPTGQYLFTGYGSGYLNVNNVRYERSLVITPERVIEDWPVADFDGLNSSHFEFLRALNPAIVLLGSGATLRFPRPELSRCLTDVGVGLDVMDTAAACRTYNILATEGRNVVAAVLLA